jgi:hypothetical protein
MRVKFIGGYCIARARNQQVARGDLPQRLLVQSRVGGGDETVEQGMRAVRFALEFRMKLAGDEKWVAGQFDDFDQFTVGRPSAKAEAGFGERLVIIVVEFVAMPVALVDDESAIQARGVRAHRQLASLASQAHRAALGRDLLLLIQQRDDRVRGPRIEFGGMGFLQFEHVAGELNSSRLHAQAKTQVRHILFARITGGLDFPFDAALAKAPWN